MNETVRGLVLRSMDYREYDALFSVLTREYGKLTFLGTGARRMTSKNASALLPYSETEIQFDYRNDKTMYRLHTARTISLNRYIHEDLNAGTAAEAAGEIADAFSYPGSEYNAADIYAYTEKAFALLNNRTEPKLVLTLYIADMMRINGIEPNVDSCVRDGNPLVSAISVKDGGFLCRSCALEEGEKLRTKEELRLFRLLVKAGLKHLDVIQDMKVDVSSSLKLLEAMLERQGNIKIHSFQLFNRVNQVD